MRMALKYVTTIRACIRSPRLRIAMLATLLAGLSPAQAASPHYNLFAVFPPSGTGTAMTHPQAIIQGTGGYFYGVANKGGYNGLGGVFDVRPDGIIDTMIDYGSGSTDTIGWLWSPLFPYHIDPLAALANGDFVGVSVKGGPATMPGGVAYDVGGTSGAYSVLHAFDQSTSTLTGPLDIAVSADGNYYGFATGGQRSGDVPTSYGNFFSLTPNGAVTDLYDFSSTDEPSLFLLNPRNNDMFFVNGIAPSTESLSKVDSSGAASVLHVMDPANDGMEVEQLVIDANDNVYGATAGGGAGTITNGVADGWGTVFEQSATGTFSVLHAFNNDSASIKDGYWPTTILAATDGNIYGMTQAGGDPAYSNGTVFRISPSGTYTVLRTLGSLSVDGSEPQSLIQTGPRTFAGVMVQGGPNGTGGIFKLTVPIQDDFTGNGMSNLLMSGPGALTLGTAASVGSTRSIASGYYPVAIGDLNGDGIADIVWTSANHDLYLWLGGTSGFSSRYIGTYPAGWKVEAAADVNGDGMDDLLWLNSQTNQFAYWLMNGQTRIGAHVTNIASGYYPAAIGDFDGNGKVDILWTSARHDLYAWIGNGSTFKSSFISNFPAGWRIMGRGDLTGNGKDDLIWATNDGSKWGYWLMDGATLVKAKAFSVPAGLSGYKIAETADYNGDGRDDIIWSDGTYAVPWTNQDNCSPTVDCSFSSDSPLSLPVNELVFNSSLPTTDR